MIFLKYQSLLRRGTNETEPIFLRHLQKITSVKIHFETPRFTISQKQIYQFYSIPSFTFSNLDLPAF